MLFPNLTTANTEAGLFRPQTFSAPPTEGTLEIYVPHFPDPVAKITLKQGKRRWELDFTEKGPPPLVMRPSGPPLPPTLGVVGVTGRPYYYLHVPRIRVPNSGLRQISVRDTYLTLADTHNYRTCFTDVSARVGDAFRVDQGVVLDKGEIPWIAHLLGYPYILCDQPFPRNLPDERIQASSTSIAEIAAAQTNDPHDTPVHPHSLLKEQTWGHNCLRLLLGPELYKTWKDAGYILTGEILSRFLEKWGPDKNWHELKAKIEILAALRNEMGEFDFPLIEKGAHTLLGRINTAVAVTALLEGAGVKTEKTHDEFTPLCDWGTVWRETGVCLGLDEKIGLSHTVKTVENTLKRAGYDTQSDDSQKILENLPQVYAALPSLEYYLTKNPLHSIILALAWDKLKQTENTEMFIPFFLFCLYNSKKNPRIFNAFQNAFNSAQPLEPPLDDILTIFVNEREYYHAIRKAIDSVAQYHIAINSNPEDKTKTPSPVIQIKIMMELFPLLLNPFTEELLHPLSRLSEIYRHAIDEGFYGFVSERERKTKGWDLAYSTSETNYHFVARILAANDDLMEKYLERATSHFPGVPEYRKGRDNFVKQYGKVYTWNDIEKIRNDRLATASPQNPAKRPTMMIVAVGREKERIIDAFRAGYDVIVVEKDANIIQSLKTSFQNMSETFGGEITFVKARFPFLSDRASKTYKGQIDAVEIHNMYYDHNAATLLTHIVSLLRPGGIAAIYHPFDLNPQIIRQDPKIDVIMLENNAPAILDTISTRYAYPIGCSVVVAQKRADTNKI